MIELLLTFLHVLMPMINDVTDRGTPTFEDIRQMDRSVFSDRRRLSEKIFH